LGLQRINLAEDVGGKALDAVEILRHIVPAADEWLLLSLQAFFGEAYTTARRFAPRVGADM
jgi:hypothetical protein